MIKLVLLAGAAALAITGVAEAHTRKHHDRVKFVCDDAGCAVKVTSHGHHHHTHARKTKIRFNGNVCVYRPWKNITVCRY